MSGSTTAPLLPRAQRALAGAEGGDVGTSESPLDSDSRSRARQIAGVGEKDQRGVNGVFPWATQTAAVLSLEKCPEQIRTRRTRRVFVGAFGENATAKCAAWQACSFWLDCYCTVDRLRLSPPQPSI